MNFCCGKYALTLVLGSIALFGTSGCTSQITHFSGQIGRYYGDGVSFSVPMVKKAEDPRHEDSFWEVRQGIGRADVVVLGPFITDDGAQSFRENMVFSSNAIEPGSDVAQFRTKQIEALKSEFNDATNFFEGQDDTGYWVTFERTVTGTPSGDISLSAKAWFFLDEERSIGYVLVGTARKSDNIDRYYNDFNDIAKTVRFGLPQSGFACMSEVLRKAVVLETVENDDLSQIQLTTEEANIPNSVEQPEDKGTISEPVKHTEPDRK